MMRSDWEYVDRVIIEGYNIGFRVTEGARGAANAQFRRLILRDCEIALSVDKDETLFGMVFYPVLHPGQQARYLIKPGVRIGCLIFRMHYHWRACLRIQGQRSGAHGAMHSEEWSYRDGRRQPVDGWRFVRKGAGSTVKNWSKSQRCIVRWSRPGGWQTLHPQSSGQVRRAVFGRAN